MNWLKTVVGAATSSFRQLNSQSRTAPTDQQIIDAATGIAEKGMECIVSEVQETFMVSPERIRSVLEPSADTSKRKFGDYESSGDHETSRMSKSMRSHNIDVEQSLGKISHALENGPKEQIVSGKRQVVIVGVTGSGKSTVVNSLAGCRLRKLTENEADRLNISRQSLCVVSVGDGGPMDHVTEIGNQHGQSCTSKFQAVELAELGLCIWDIPGFDDTQGPEINIANAVNLSKLLKASQEHGLIIFVALDMPSLESKRGQVIKDTSEVLKTLFNSVDGGDIVQRSIDGILFCVTKATRDCVSLETARNWIVSGAEAAGLNLSGVRDQIVIYDPLHKNKEAISRDILLGRVLTMKPISPSQQIMFQPNLGAQEQLLIQAIAGTTKARILSAMSTENFKSPNISMAIQHLKLFRSLTEIGDGQIINLHDSMTTLQKDSPRVG